MRRGGLWLTAIALAVALCAASCTGDDSGAAGSTTAASPPETSSAATPAGNNPVTFGAFNFSESTILANIYAQAAAAAGVPTQVEASVGNREAVYKQLFDDKLDVVPEYSGSAVVQLGSDATSDEQTMHDELTKLMNDNQVGVLESAPAENRDAIAVTLDTATRLDIHTMSQLASHSGDLTFAGPTECPQRPLCLPGYEKTYGIKFKSFVTMDSGLPTASALARGDVDAANVFTTDATISVFTLVVLDDDKGLFPAEDITPVVRRDVLAQYPQLVAALNKVSAVLTTRDLLALNYSVVIGGRPPAEAATTWLQDKGLLRQG